MNDEGFKQAKWNEPLLVELEETPESAWYPDEVGEVDIPKHLLREKLDIPNVSEPLVVRHFTRLSQMNYGVDLGIYPLGSCTMKYTPKICEELLKNRKIRDIHPLIEEEHVQGLLQILYELSIFLAEITGAYKVSLQPSAGAHGELTGCLIMRAYHELNGESFRNEILIPDSAHGTNPASASMAGYKVVVIPSNEEGRVDVEALKEVADSKKTAGLMLTNPNTLGIFEKDIVEIAKIVHEVGGLLYYDGANLNAILGKCRPCDMGFDIVHINLHKTFGTPHGGGGPGAGPVGVVEKLVDFLPVPTVEFDGERYYLNYDIPHTIGKVHSFYGHIDVLLKAYIYILLHGAKYLEKIAEISVLNSNYLMKRILETSKGIELPYTDDPRKHEFVVSAKKLYKETGVRALNISKRLLDFGMHAPTMYFPLIVEEALMVEPTETVCKKDLDDYADAISKITEEAYSNPNAVLGAPYNTSVRRVDEVKASHPRTMCLTWKFLKGVRK